MSYTLTFHKFSKIIICTKMLRKSAERCGNDAEKCGNVRKDAEMMRKSAEICRNIFEVDK